MIKNPIQLRLEKLSNWQHHTFMACLCERMYPNYAFFCQQTQFGDAAKYKQLLDLVWETLSVKGAKINFESQLDKLELIIPEIEQYDCYSVYPAADACRALGELLHAQLTTDTAEHAVKVSTISLTTIATLEMSKAQQQMSEETLKSLPMIIEELDLHWEIYRLLKSVSEPDIELIKGLRQELREAKTSNIGVFLDC